MLPVSAQQPIPHVVINNKIKVKFPTAVSLCAYTATRMGINVILYSIIQVFSLTWDIGLRRFTLCAPRFAKITSLQKKH